MISASFGRPLAVSLWNPGPGLRRCRASYLLAVVLCGDDEDLQAQRGPPQLLPQAPQTLVLLLTAALQPLHLERHTGEHSRVQENIGESRRTQQSPGEQSIMWYSGE